VDVKIVNAAHHVSALAVIVNYEVN